MEPDRPIVLFDGVCNFCGATVEFVFARDRRARFQFAPLQSHTAQELLQRFGLPTDRLDTVALVEGDRCYTKSHAMLRVMRDLSAPWPLLYALMLIPRPIRDFFYDGFAARRYRWFGKRASCLVPTPELQARFLD